MKENLHVGTHKLSHKNYDKIFGSDYKFDVCRTCSISKANGGNDVCVCSLVVKGLQPSNLHDIMAPS